MSVLNIGVIAAQGDIILFLDADVCVHTDTIPRVMAEFADDPELDAVMGSYDESPSATTFVSRYRNLMHSSAPESQPRGGDVLEWRRAIRRLGVPDAGGFDDQHYHAPAIEDVELGYRLKKANRKLG